MVDFYPHRRILTIWRMVAAAFALAAAFAVALLFGQHPLLFRLTTGLWVVVFLGFFVIYCPIKYNRLKYSVGNGQVLLRGGVLYRRVKAIPLSNIQFTAAFCLPPAPAVWPVHCGAGRRRREPFPHRASPGRMPPGWRSCSVSPHRPKTDRCPISG